jgi:hypothetical protein
MDEVHGSIWSDREVDLIVADYFNMLAAELAGQSYSKAKHNEALQSLIQRSRKSIEFKHCNISAVLERLGLPSIAGYRPLPHFQNALIDGVERHLNARGAPLFEFVTAAKSRVAESPSLWIGPPPSVSPKDEKETQRLRQLVHKFDPAERDARNRKLGKQGEELALEHEIARLKQIGRDDLSRKVEWTSEVRGDGAGYDIRSFENDGKDRLIEVKTTNGPAKTPFFLSENELAFSEERPDAFRLLRLYQFVEKPSAFELQPPLSDRLALHPSIYRATLN